MFAAYDVKTGHVIGKTTRRHREIEYLKFLDQVDDDVRSDLDIHLILDNYSTHKARIIKAWLDKRPRYHLHITTTYASWLNQVERWCEGVEAKQRRRGVHTSVRSLEAAIRCRTAPASIATASASVSSFRAPSIQHPALSTLSKSRCAVAVGVSRARRWLASGAPDW